MTLLTIRKGEALLVSGVFVMQMATLGLALFQSHLGECWRRRLGQQIRAVFS